MKGQDFNFSTEELKERSILYAYRGSKSHNTYVPSTDPHSIDDIDTMAIYIAPKNYYLGVKQKQFKSKYRVEGEYDEVFEEVARFIGLLLKQNPNVLGMLWLKPHLYIKKKPLGQLLIDNKEIFSSRIAYKSFTGYAHAQLYKMDHIAGNGYLGAKRKKLVKKFGYDTKNGSHCLRLLQMGLEFITTGELNVWREDAQKYINIKQGKWTLDEVRKEAERLFKLTDQAIISSPLPLKPDIKKADELCMYIIEEGLKT